MKSTNRPIQLEKLFHRVGGSAILEGCAITERESDESIGTFGDEGVAFVKASADQYVGATFGDELVQLFQRVDAASCAECEVVSVRGCAGVLAPIGATVVHKLHPKIVPTTRQCERQRLAATVNERVCRDVVCPRGSATDQIGLVALDLKSIRDDLPSDFTHLGERAGGQPERILAPASSADDTDHSGFTSKISTSDL